MSEPIKKEVQIVEEKKQDLTTEKEPVYLPSVDAAQKEIVAYYQLHKNGTAVPVKTTVENCRMARQNALERGIPVILPGEALPPGIKVIEQSMNRKTRRYFEKLKSKWQNKRGGK